MSCLNTHIWKPAYKIQGIISYCGSLFILWGRKKRSNHPATQGEMRRALVLPWVTLAGSVWWKESENLRSSTFLPLFFFCSSSPGWFPSLILLLLQFMASGLVLWLKQVPLTKPQISAEFLCPSTEANQGTAHEALFKLIHAHHYHSPLLLNPPREPVSTPGNKSGFKPHTCSMVLRMSWLSSCIHNVLGCFCKQIGLTLCSLGKWRH